MRGLFQRLLDVRGIDSRFLNPVYPTPSEGLIGGILEGVETLEEARMLEGVAKRLLAAAERGEKVLIYGDYDVDGVTASALMHEVLELIGVKEIEVMLPDRFKDGYGMSQRCVEEVVRQEVDLVVTVDCGTSNADIVAALTKKGIETVVTDHHAVLTAVPEGWFLNFQVGQQEELRNLCGVGVVFMIAQELVRQGAIADGREKWMLDLVLIGTICDAMPLKGLNRDLCYYGMKVLAKTQRVGLRELMKTAGVDSTRITAEAVGFQLGPRLNAAGRMASAQIAYDLLTTKSRVKAVALAARLEELNAARKKAQITAVKTVAEVGVGKEPVMTVVDSEHEVEWHEGILGIVAGRLVEQYKKPCFVLAEVEEGVLKGSGRSFGEFNLALALSECQDCFTKYGGHAGACGLTMPKKRLTEFRTRVNDYYKGLNLRDQGRFLEVTEDTMITDFGELTEGLLHDLQGLEPYGEGNPEPIFLIHGATILETQRMGAEGQHLRITLRDGRGQTLKTIAFYAPTEWYDLAHDAMVDGESLELWVSLCINEWNGRTTVEGRLVQIKNSP